MSNSATHSCIRRHCHGVHPGREPVERERRGAERHTVNRHARSGWLAANHQLSRPCRGLVRELEGLRHGASSNDVQRNDTRLAIGADDAQLVRPGGRFKVNGVTPRAVPSMITGAPAGSVFTTSVPAASATADGMRLSEGRPRRAAPVASATRAAAAQRRCPQSCCGRGDLATEPRDPHVRRFGDRGLRHRRRAGQRSGAVECAVVSGEAARAARAGATAGAGVAATVGA